MKVCDAHLHLAWADAVPRSFLEASARNIAAALSARGHRGDADHVARRLVAEMDDRDADGLVAQMDEARIERGALLVPDLTYALPGPGLTIEEVLRHHARVGARHPGRFALLAGVDPRWSSDGVALFERAVRDWGFRGLKLYPPCGFDPSDRMVYPFYEICRAARLPVLVHIGPSAPNLSLEHVRPFCLDRAVRDFPEVSFILGHGTAHFADECALLAAYRPNVFIETSGCHRGGALGQASAHLLPFVRQGLAHKLLFGTDWPIFRYSLASMVEAVFAGDGIADELSEGDLSLVAGGLFARLFPA